jgi:hypothetical protein
MRRFLVLLPIGIALASHVACVSSVPPQVTCESVRSLQLGMPQARVIDAVGPPVTRAPASGCARDLAQSGLSGVYLYQRSLWMDRSENIYSLDKEGLVEDASFSKRFHCPAK